MYVESNAHAQQHAVRTTCQKILQPAHRRILRETLVSRIAYRWNLTRRRTTRTVPAWISTKRRYEEKFTPTSQYQVHCLILSTLFNKSLTLRYSNNFIDKFKKMQFTNHNLSSFGSFEQLGGNYGSPSISRYRNHKKLISH